MGTRRSNYLRLLDLAVAEGLVRTEGGRVLNLSVFHEDSCLSLLTGGAESCACACEVTVCGRHFRWVDWHEVLKGEAHPATNGGSAAHSRSVPPDADRSRSGP